MKAERPAVAADLAVVTRDRQVLLIRRGREPFTGRWALPGGFVEPGERCEQAAHRELEEETGVRVGEATLLGVYDRPGRDPRGWVITTTYLARIDAKVDALGADDAAEAAWFPLDELPELAFDHDEVLEDVARAV